MSTNSYVPSSQRNVIRSLFGLRLFSSFQQFFVEQRAQGVESWRRLNHIVLGSLVVNVSWRCANPRNLLLVVCHFLKFLRDLIGCLAIVLAPFGEQFLSFSLWIFGCSRRALRRFTRLSCVTSRRLTMAVKSSRSVAVRRFS